MGYQDHANRVSAALRTAPSEVKQVGREIMTHAGQMRYTRAQHLKAQALERDPARKQQREQHYQQQRAADQARSGQLLNQAKQALANHAAEVARRESIMTPMAIMRNNARTVFATPVEYSDLSGLLESATNE